MSSVFRPKRKVNGKTVVRPHYSGKFRLPGDAKPTVVALQTKDRQTARRKLDKIIAEREQERLGMIPSASVREAQARPLLEHLDDFTRSRDRIGRNWRYVKELGSRLRRVIDECQWKTVTDISAASFTAWRDAQTKMSAKTKKEYQISVSGFVSWLRKNKRGLTDNPLDSVESISLAGKHTFKRRALSTPEIEALLAVAGTHRPIYLLAIYTGLRRSELKQLEWRDVVLDSATPHLKVRAATTKNSKDATIELHPLAVEALRALHARGEVSPTARVFHGIFPKLQAFKNDLKRAGIAGEAHLGYKVDFHSFRHTFGTLLSIAGTPLAVAKGLMRHSDAKLTLDVYTTRAFLPTADAINSLPRFGVTGQGCSPRRSPVLCPEGQNGAQAGTNGKTDNHPQSLINTASGHDEARSGTNEEWCAIQGSNSEQSRINTGRGGGMLTPALTCGENASREGFEICEILAAWPSLPEALRAAVMAIVRTHGEDLSINGRMAEVAAAQAPQGKSLGAGVPPELPVCGQVAPATNLTASAVARAKHKKPNKRKPRK